MKHDRRRSLDLNPGTERQVSRAGDALPRVLGRSADIDEDAAIVDKAFCLKRSDLGQGHAALLIVKLRVQSLQ